MDIYTLMRQFADSWALLALVVAFLCVFVWAWRPGAKKVHEEIAESIFQNEDHPAPLPSDKPPAAKQPSDKESL